MKLYSCKGYYKDDNQEIDDVTICSSKFDDVAENDDDIFYYAINEPVLGDHGDFVITLAERIDPVQGIRSYLKNFDIYLPTQADVNAEYCETVEIECYKNFTDIEFVTSESSQLIEGRRIYHWEKKYGKIK